MTKYHWSTDQFSWSLAYTERFWVGLNVSRGFEASIQLSYQSRWSLRSVVDLKTATPDPFQTSGNFTKNGKSTENEGFNQLTFIFGFYLWFGTAAGLLWTSSSHYLRNGWLGGSHLDSLPSFSLTNFSQLVNDDFLCFWHTLKSWHLWYQAMIYLTPKILLFLYKYIDTENIQKITSYVNH